MTDTPDLRRLGTCDAAQFGHIAHAEKHLCVNWKPLEPALPELLEKARVMTPEEKEARCVHCGQSLGWQKRVPDDNSCAQGYWYSRATGSYCPKSEFGHERTREVGGAQPEPDELQFKLEHSQAQMRSASALIGKIQKIVGDFFGENERWSEFDVLDQGVRKIAEQARAGSSPAPTDSIRCMECKASVCDHIANTLLELNMVDAPRGSSPAPSPPTFKSALEAIANDPIIGKETLDAAANWYRSIAKRALEEATGVTGNEGKDERDSRGNTDRLHGGSGSGDSVSGMGTAGGNVAPLASPAGVTPEQQDYDLRCREINQLRHDASLDHEMVAAHKFYVAHPEFWIYPLAASGKVGDGDKALLRVHAAMGAYAQAKVSELEAQLQQAQRLLQSEKGAHLVFCNADHAKPIGSDICICSPSRLWEANNKMEAELERIRTGGKS